MLILVTIEKVDMLCIVAHLLEQRPIWGYLSSQICLCFDSFLELRKRGSCCRPQSGRRASANAQTIPFLRQVVEHPPAKHATRRNGAGARLGSQALQGASLFSVGMSALFLGAAPKDACVVASCPLAFSGQTSR